jgi:hypothetical protein
MSWEWIMPEQHAIAERDLRHEQHTKGEYARFFWHSLSKFQLKSPAKSRTHRYGRQCGGRKEDCEEGSQEGCTSQGSKEDCEEDCEEGSSSQGSQEGSKEGASTQGSKAPSQEGSKEGASTQGSKAPSEEGSQEGCQAPSEEGSQEGRSSQGSKAPSEEGSQEGRSSQGSKEGDPSPLSSKTKRPAHVVRAFLFRQLLLVLRIPRLIALPGKIKCVFSVLLRGIRTHPLSVRCARTELGFTGIHVVPPLM